LYLLILDSALKPFSREKSTFIFIYLRMLLLLLFAAFF